MVRLGEPVFDVVCLAGHVEAHLARPSGVAVTRLLGELNAIVRQNSVDAVRHGCQQVFEELPGCAPVRLVDELGDRKFARAVDADEQVELAFGSLHLSDIDMEETDRVALEALSLRLFALDVWQAGDAVPLKGFPTGGIMDLSPNVRPIYIAFARTATG